MLDLCRRVVEGEGGTLRSAPSSVPLLAEMAARLEAPAVTAVVSAPGPTQEAVDLLLAAWRVAPPGAVVVPFWASEWPPEEASALPLLKGRLAPEGPRAFVCAGERCLAPAATPEEVQERLRRAL